MTNWHFDKAPSGMSTGWDDASIKGFKGNPINNLAREIIQNSLDAAVDKKNGCVTVRFSLLPIPTTSIPDHETLKGVIKKCISSVLDADKPKAKEAMSRLEKKSIDLLSISETGTIGMKGPYEEGKPFFTYMATSSQSVKSNDSLGSHGQGKAAPILCSHLHTIFASTVYLDEGKKEQRLVMGRATLASHYNNPEEKKDKRFNIGFWGSDPVDTEYTEPVRSTKNLPAWLKRDGQGTDIHILGFKSTKNWELILIASVVCNFFTAIEDDKLIVEVAGKHVINSETVADLFDKKDVLNALDNSTQDLPYATFIKAKGLYEAFKTSNTKVVSVLHLGDMKFYMRGRDDQEKQIGLVRGNIFITSSIPYLHRFPKALDGFDVLIEPISKEGVELIRSMEPTAHNAIEVDHIDDEKEKSKANTALKQLAEKTRELLEEQFGNRNISSDDIPAFAKWFPDDSDTGDEDDEDDPSAGFTFIKKTSVGNGHPPPPNGKKNVQLRNIRMIPRAGKKLQLIFCSAVSGEILLQVYEMGADTANPQPLVITKTNEGKVIKQGAKRGGVELTVEKNFRNILEVEAKDYSGRAVKLQATKAGKR